MPRSCFDLTGRVAVVFGGTSGLGEAIAHGLAEHGSSVVASGRRSAKYPSDVRDRASIRQLRDQVLSEFGHIHILVNAAGVTFRKPTREVADAEWNELFEANLTGTLHTCQEFYEDLKVSGAGRVINIASLGSYLAFHEVAAYCASKAAVLSLTRNLACEWARDGICVNAIAPGVFPTELNSHLLRGTARGREILTRTPMQRFGQPRELVGAAVLLASDGASFITGHCLTVDGGYLASGVNA